MATLSSAPFGVTITYRLERRKCGNKKCRRCQEGGTLVGHGPYWYAYWHDPGKHNNLVSGYVGKKAPAGYENVTEEISAARCSSRSSAMIEPASA